MCVEMIDIEVIKIIEVIEMIEIEVVFWSFYFNFDLPYMYIFCERKKSAMVKPIFFSNFIFLVK